MARRVPNSLVRALDRFIPDDSPLGRAGDAQMLLRVTGGNVREAAFLAALARKESSFGKYAFAPNNFWGWGVHLGPDVNTAPTVEAMARRVLRGLRGGLYRGAGLTRPREIIARYAPSSENNTPLYQDQVSQWFRQMGLDPTQSIFGGPTVRASDAHEAGASSGGGAPAPAAPAMDPRVYRLSLLAAVRRLHSGGDRIGALSSLVGLIRQQQQAAEQTPPPGELPSSPENVPADNTSGDFWRGPLARTPARNVSFGTAPGGGYDWAQELARRFGLTVTSGYRTPAQQRATGSRAGMRSRHLVRGGAADIAGPPENMRRLAEWAIRSRRFAEVFYDPLGFYWDEGRLHRGGIGGHSDHVHLSFGLPISRRRS